MLFDAKIKPRLWNLKTGTVAYNCARMGLPVPVLTMPFWEGTGNKVFDYSGNQNHGTITGAIWKKRGLYLDGTNDSVSIPYNSALDEKEITISIWIKFESLDSVGIYPGIFARVNGNDAFNILFKDTTNKIAFYVKKGSWSSVEWATIPTIDKWYHLILTHSGTTLEGFVDLVSVGTDVNGNPITRNSSNYLIGGYTNTDYINAIIDVPIIWNVKLSATQRQVIHNNSYGMFEPIRDYRIWSFISGGVFYKTITGSMPASAGNVVSVSAYKQIIVGDMPNPMATIAKHIDIQMVGNVPTPVATIVKKTDKQFVGEQPTPTGDVVPISIYKQAISGNTPNPTAIVVKGVEKGIIGNIPNPVADITKKISIQIAGSIPTTTANIIKKTEKELAGEQLSPAGNVTYKSVYKQAVVGSNPTPIGSLSSTIKTALAVVGNMPATIGDAIKRISKVLSGNIPTSTGNITRQTEKNIAGEQPAPAGSVSHTTKTFLSGIMGNITGILDTVFNPISPTAIKLCKIIGSCFKKLIG